MVFVLNLLTEKKQLCSHAVSQNVHGGNYLTLKSYEDKTPQEERVPGLSCFHYYLYKCLCANIRYEIRKEFQFNKIGEFPI